MKVDAVLCLDNLEAIGKVVCANILVAIVECLTVRLRKFGIAGLFCTGAGLHLMGLPEHGTYAATKAALRSFARTWAMELKVWGIRVNAFAGGDRYAHYRRPVQTKEEADGARVF